MKSKKILIIGSGIGGLALANLLAHAGHTVTVYEKESTAGGRAGQKIVNGFTFDTGPSWYLMPEVFKHYYELIDEPVSKWLKLVKLKPAYKVFFENAPAVTITGVLNQDVQTFEAIEPGSGKELRKYITKSNEMYQLSLKYFLYSNFERATDFFHKDIFIKIFQLPKLLLQPINTYVSTFVRDQRLKQILEYPMVFLGTSPFNAPAMYSLMSALDFKEGVFYPQGGMYTIIKSLEAIGRSKGVKYLFNSPVKRILTEKSIAKGIVLESGEEVFADIVISNADLHFTETKLLVANDQSFPEQYWNKKSPGPSALLLYLGIKGKIPEFTHHNLLLVDEWEENFNAIYTTKSVPNKASLYISKTSHTDPSVAPANNENIFILVPLPATITVTDKEVEHMTDHYLTQIHQMTGVNLKNRIVVEEVFKPNDFQTKFHSWQSSMLGQSHILKQSAFFRTPNKSKKVKNLYYVGGNTMPGIGLPMCLIGAELVFKRIIGDKKGGRLENITKVVGAE